MSLRLFSAALIAGLGVGSVVATGQRDEAGSAADPPPPRASDAADESPEPLPPPPGLVELAPGAQVWIDYKEKQVIADGRVAIRKGQLEMFACPQGTKEHESIVAITGKAFLVHAGLLAIGAKAGKTVQYEPEYRPASGPVVDITVRWKDANGKEQSSRAQQWVRNVKTKEAMKHDWVFAGSKFWQDPVDGRRYYQGDGGDFICVANFPTATLDLPVQSDQANSSLLFEAFTERVPPRGTPVRLELKPRLPKKAAAVEKGAE